MADKLEHILSQLRSLGNKQNRLGMARFGIRAERAFGVKITTLREIVKEIGKDHALALELWATGYHEARMLATMLADPQQASETLLEAWLKDIDSWDLCDGFTGNLVDKTPFANDKATEWSQREPEFERRAGFALMAWMAVHDKKAPDAKFVALFPHIEAAADDERTYVKKAVCWALRGIGKRNWALQAQAVALAEKIGRRGSKAARWIAADVLKELTGDKVREKLDKQARS